MDIQAQLAKSIQRILQSEKPTQEIGSLPSAKQPNELKGLVDQFNKNRSDMLQKLGTYTKGAQLNLIRGLTESQTLIFREMSQQIHTSILSTLSNFITQNQPEAYLSSLLIQSFNWIAKRLKKEEKRNHQNKKGQDAATHSIKKDSTKKRDQEASKHGKHVLESLLSHIEEHGKDDEYIFWAEESLKQTQKQLELHQINLTEETKAVFKIAYDAITAIKSGMSVHQIRSIITDYSSPNNRS